MTDTTTPSVRSPSDAELITLARAGDDHAYSELYRRHEGSARAAARSLTRSRADADDLVADGFVRVLQALRSGKGPEVAFRPYLLTAVRNAFYDRLRKDKRVDVTAEPPERVNVQLLDMAASEDDRALVARAFATLPERWQVVLWHSEVEGRSASEIGTTLGLAPNAVAALAYRAREGLRQAYLQAHLQREVPQGCKEPRGNLGGYVRNSLSSRDHRKVEAHLDECRQCRALLGDLDDANRQLSAVLIPILIGVPAAKYLAGIGAGKGILAILRRAPRSTQAGAGVGVAAAAAAVVVIATSVAGRLGVNESDARPISTAARRVVTSPAETSPEVDTSADTRAPDTTTAPSTVVETTQPLVPPAGALPLTPDPTTSTTAAPLVLAPNTTVPRSPAAPRPAASPSTTTRPPTTVTTTQPPTVAPTTLAPTTVPASSTTTATTTTSTAPVLRPLKVSVTSDLDAIAGQYAYLRVAVEHPAGNSPQAQLARSGGAPSAPRPEVTFELPDGSELASFEPGWQCVLDGRTVRCSLPDVSAGTTVSGVVEVRLASTAPSEVIFQPKVSAAGFVGATTRTAVAIADGGGTEYFRSMRGGLVTAGNSSMVCADDLECEAARHGTASGDRNHRHVHYMEYVDVDGLPSTFNSSSATLNVPMGATIEHAVLVWSADIASGGHGAVPPNGDDRGEVLLVGPAGQSAVVAHRVVDDGSRFVAYADVTDAVTGTGTYTVADIQAATGEGRFGGWVLMVAYQQAEAPLSLVAMSADPAATRAIVGASQRVPIGSVRPAPTPRNGSLTWAAFEGDRSIANETVAFNGVKLAGHVDRPTDLFDSSVPLDRVPADENTFGVDIDSFDITVAAGDTILELTVTSPADRVRWGLTGWTLVVE